MLNLCNSKNKLLWSIR